MTPLNADTPEGADEDEYRMVPLSEIMMAQAVLDDSTRTSQPKADIIKAYLSGWRALTAAATTDVVDAKGEYHRGWLDGAKETVDVCKSIVMSMMNHLGSFKTMWNSPPAVADELQSLIDRCERAALTVEPKATGVCCPDQIAKQYINSNGDLGGLV